MGAKWLPSYLLGGVRLARNGVSQAHKVLNAEGFSAGAWINTCLADQVGLTEIG